MQSSRLLVECSRHRLLPQPVTYSWPEQ